MKSFEQTKVFDEFGDVSINAAAPSPISMQKSKQNR
jgi:hypothetical protein